MKVKFDFKSFNHLSPECSQKNVLISPQALVIGIKNLQLFTYFYSCYLQKNIYTSQQLHSVVFVALQHISSFLLYIIAYNH